jgi:amidohydrolase
MALLNKIKLLSETYHKDTVAWRRHLHANPELSYEEFNTSKFVAAQLRASGIEPRDVATTGIVALIRGNNPEKRIVALRADMDALPIQELNNVSYKSTKPGVMHACGHDVHTSSLLATAKILQDVRDQFEGTIKLIFQPGE